MKFRITIFKISLILLAVLMIPSCAVNPVTGKKQIMMMSEAQEVAMGADYDPQVVATFGNYEDEAILNLITQKGIEMGKLSHRPNLQYHFKILDTEVINAFAVPGGYIYLTRGILAQLNNEAELMGILGHEMGHITARHSVQQMSKQQLAQVILVGGMIISEEVRQFADVAMQGMQLLFMKFSRDNEREADRLGVEYSSRIGYDAHKMADFFNVLKKMQMASDHGGVPTFMSTHPDPGDRYNSVNQKADQWQDSLKLANYEVNADKYLQMIDGLVYGADPRQGFIEGNTFYHPNLKFQFPFSSGWKLVNSPMQVQIVPPDQKGIVVFSLAQQKTLDQAASATMQQFKLEVLNTTKTTVNQFPAIVINSQQVSTNEQTGETSTMKVLSYFIEYNGAIYTFHGASSGVDFIRFENDFKLTMSNFSRLTNPSKLNVEPQRIRIRRVQQSGTVADVFKYYGVKQAVMEELALLNNLELTDRLASGTMIKIIGY